jgi:hypothetical protein
MPLRQLDGNGYLATTKVYANSSDDRGGGPNSRFRVALNTELRDVVSVELTGFSIPRSIGPTFPLGQDYVDFHVYKNAERFDFSFQIPQASYTISTLVAYLDNTMHTLAWNALGSGVFFIVEADAINKLTFTFVWASSLLTFSWGLDFRSGPNSTNSAYSLLGFEQEDYTGTDVSFRDLAIEAPSPTNLNLFRYIDISLEEIPELQPMKRIYIGNTDTYTLVNQAITPRTRILTNTERLNRLRYITINASLGGGQEVLDVTYDLEFTIYNLEADDNVPDWVQETFLL